MIVLAKLDSQDAEAPLRLEDFKGMNLEEAISALRTNPSEGLSDSEAQYRIRINGLNEVPEIKEHAVVRFGKKFWGLTAWALEFTMFFSYIIGSYFDVYVIAALLLVNAAIGTAQEEKASSTVESLSQRLQVIARVLRNGAWKSMQAKMLVPGDIVRVRAGDFVPADLLILDSGILEVDQSALTGESLPVSRSKGETLFSGSVVRSGENNAVVAATGTNTYFGQTTKLLQTSRPRLHMEEVTTSIVKWLVAMVGALIAMMFLLTYLDSQSLLPVIPLALVLIVFAIPVSLPAMFTVSMASGSNELARKGVLVTRLSASEDAASMNILCADKTGTITANRLTLTSTVPFGRYTENDIITYGALASEEANQDPIDSAFIAASRNKGINLSAYRKERFLPFNPKNRRTEADVSDKEGRFTVTKGAVDTILEICGGMQLSRAAAESMEEYATKGYRTLAVASSRNGKLEPCGIVALYDAPRPDSRELVRELADLGVSTKILTGDALPIAREIAGEVGLGNNVVNASDLRAVLEKEQQKAGEIAQTQDGFAGVYPEDKYVIVRSLQASGNVTGMTGDGVNDAPALRQAEVGIAVSTATDVAKGAASVVLTGEGLSNIVTLVQEGRKIYQRIVTWVLNKIVKTFQVAVFTALALLLTGLYVVSALDIILLLFVIDFVTLSLATDNVRWSRRPERWDVSALAKVSVSLGILTIIELFILFYMGLGLLGLGTKQGELQTFIFASLFFLGMFTVLIVRERERFYKSRPSSTLITAILADMVIVGVMVTVGIPGMKPIPVMYVAIIVAYFAFVSFLFNDALKCRLMKRFGVSMD